MAVEQLAHDVGRREPDVADDPEANAFALQRLEAGADALARMDGGAATALAEAFDERLLDLGAELAVEALEHV